LRGDEPLRVGFITQWFAPEPVTNPVWIATALRDQGIRIGVATGIPNYPTGRVQAPYVSYRRYREEYDGIPVVRSPLYSSHDRSVTHRAANYMTFAASSAIGAHGLLSRSDVNLVYASPATAALPAMVAQVTSRVPYVLYVQDIWPDSVTETGLLSPSRWTSLGIGGLTRFVEATYRGAAHIVVIAPGMKSLLISRGVPEEKVSTVHNWAAESSRPAEGSRERVRREWGCTERDIVVMYAGNHGEAQGLGAWIKGIRRVHDLIDLRFIFMGDGSQKELLRREAADLPTGTIQFLDAVHPDQVGCLLAAADAQIVSLADEPIFAMTIPGKVQANLAAGKAVVAAVTGDAADLLSASKASLLAQPGNPISIESALREVHAAGRDGLARLGANGQDFYDSVLSRAQGSRRLATVLQSVAEGNSQS